jgi:DNA-binding Lrp family transcriptional regulator
MKIRRKYLFYALAFTSAIISAIVVGIDTTITELFIDNPWAFGISCFLVGILITLLIGLILSIPIGNNQSIGSKFIDPSFKHLRLVRKNELKYHIIAGMSNSLLTLSYFILLITLREPSVVLPFSQIVILYLLVVDSFAEKNVPTLIEIQSAVIVTFGAILGSITLSGEISLMALAIVFLIYCPAWALFSIYQRKLKLLKVERKHNDAINIRFWNVVFGCIFTLVFVSIYDLTQNTSHIMEGLNASVQNFGWVALTMSVTFFAFVFYIRALGIGKASITQAVRSSVIIFTIPVSILLAFLGIIPLFSLDPVWLIIKFIGIILIILGILSFALTLTKAYIFIKIKPGAPIEKVMKQLWNIRGVTRVTAVAGKYDFIIKIRTRTLVKGYEQIIRKVEEIPGIKEYRWQSVLREWEDI